MRPTRAEFERLLLGRLRTRADAATGRVYYLDLRTKLFGGLSRMNVYSPSSPGWPERGQTTGDGATAKRWVVEGYVPYLYARFVEGAIADVGSLTVAEACGGYLSAKERLLGSEHRTVQNRRSVIRTHILPAFGSTPFTALTRRQVRLFLESLRVRKPDGRGRYVSHPAEMGTKRNVRACLLAVWRFTYPDADPPFGRIWLADEAGAAERRRKLAEGAFEELLTPSSGAYTPKQMLRILTAATWYDRHQIAARTNLSAISVPNTAAAMALAVGTGMRLDELLSLRWRFIDERDGWIIVAGTKTRAAFRIIPLQEQVRPWLAELKRLARPPSAASTWEPDPQGSVVRTNPRDPHAPGARKTLMQRFSEALRYAGLKRAKKATHWARATHATWGSIATDVVTAEQLKAYLGHASRYGGATDDYIQTLRETMPRRHRRYIRHLPSPEQVHAALAAFEPAELPPWKERRPKWSPRGKAARDRRNGTGA